MQRTVNGQPNDTYTAPGDILIGTWDVKAIGGLYGATVDWEWTMTSSAGAGSFQISDLGSITAPPNQSVEESDTTPAVTVQDPAPDWYELKIVLSISTKDMDGNPIESTKTYKYYFKKNGIGNPPGDVIPN